MTPCGGGLSSPRVPLHPCPVPQGGKGGSSLAPSQRPPGPESAQDQGFQLHLGSGGDTLRGRGAEVPLVWGRRERRGPRETICPDLQSSHTHRPPGPPPGRRPLQSRTQIHTDSLESRALTPTPLTPCPSPAAYTRETHTRTVPARPPQLPFPQSGNVRSCP